MTGPNPLDYGWWLASRSAGVVSLTAVSISVIIGLLMANGLPRKRGMKRKLLSLHESTALAGLVAIVVHGLTLLGDSFMHPSLTNIAVPFTLSYRPGFTGLGIIAGWMAMFLGLSFYARKSIGAKGMVLLPVIINKKTVGLIYADADRAETLSFKTEELSLLKTLRNPAVLAIRQKT